MNTVMRILTLAALAHVLDAEVPKSEVFTLDPQAQVYVATREVVLDDRTVKIRTRMLHTAAGDELVYDLLSRAAGVARNGGKVLLTCRWMLTAAEYAAISATMPSEIPVRGKAEILSDADFDALQGPDIREWNPPRRAP